MVKPYITKKNMELIMYYFKELQHWCEPFQKEVMKRVLLKPPWKQKEMMMSIVNQRLDHIKKQNETIKERPHEILKRMKTGITDKKKLEEIEKVKHPVFLKEKLKKLKEEEKLLKDVD